MKSCNFGTFIVLTYTMMNVYMKEKTRVFCQNSFDDLDDNIGIVMPILTECDVDEDFTEGIEKVGDTIPILPLRNMVLFPGVALPVIIGRPKSMRLIKEAVHKKSLIGVVCQKEMDTEDPVLEDLYTTGVIADIVRVLEMPDGSTTVILQGKKRFELNELTETDPYLSGKITVLEDTKPDKTDREFEALISTIKDLTIKMLGAVAEPPRDLIFSIKNNKNVLYVVNFSCSNIPSGSAEKQQLLLIGDLKERAYRLLFILNREYQLVELKASIQMKTHEDINQQQKEYFLQQQIKTIQEELGGNINELEIKELREKRIAYGISQGRLAVASGITREYLNKIESGKMKPSKELLETLHKELARFNPEAPLTMLFDYVKIRFPTLDIQHIIKDILKLNINYMLHEDYGHYSYTEHYSLGDIFIYTSADEEKGVLLELKGRGCRQFESYLLAQQRSWYDFLMDALVDGGVMKRIDLAINDHTGILDIPELAEKCRKREYIGKSRSYKFYQSGELIKHREDDREYMGRTLYLGSLKSDVYFCIYEKDYEQYVKLGTPLEEADIINRFEIRLRNERAYYAVRDLLTYYDAEQTAFSIINQYVRFVDEEPDKRKNDWKLNDRWAWFIGDNRQSLKLTTKPEPYTLDRTLRWVQRQVAPTLKMLKKIDKGNGTDYMETIEQQAKLTEKHEMIIKQQTTPAKDLVES